MTTAEVTRNERLEQAKVMNAQGHGYRAIARELGVGITTVRYWLNPAYRKKHDAYGSQRYKAKSEARRQQKKAELGAQTTNEHTPRSNLYHQKSREREAKIEQAKAMRAQGISHREIANFFGVMENTVANWLDPAKYAKAKAASIKSRKKQRAKMPGIEKIAGMIRTNLIPATESNSARITVTLEGKKVSSIPYDDQLSFLANHVEAVRRFVRDNRIDYAKYAITSHPDGGYVLLRAEDLIEI